MGVAETRRPVVLGVDDDPGILEVFHLLLDERYDVIDARDGAMALSIAQSETVDLVLLDLLIDGLDGIEVLRRLRAGDNDIPVVVVSGINNAWAATAAMRLGAVDYVTKPFEDQELLIVIASALEQRETLAAFGPRHAKPRVLLVGCAVGVAGAMVAALSGHGLIESVPLTGDSLAATIPTSPDVIVADVAAKMIDATDIIARLRTRFPLAPIILLGGTSHHPALSTEGDAVTVFPKNSRIRDLLDEIGAQLRPSVIRFPRFSARVFDIIEAAAAEFPAVTLHSVGALLGKSPYYLSHLFRAETGMTLNTYLSRVRVAAARHILLETADKIETVAARVGLHDASHLSRLFLKYSGRRPGDFRRHWYQEPNAP